MVSVNSHRSPLQLNLNGANFEFITKILMIKINFNNNCHYLLVITYYQTLIVDQHVDLQKLKNTNAYYLFYFYGDIPTG